MGKEKILFGAAVLMAGSTLKNKRQIDNTKSTNSVIVNEISKDLFEEIVNFKNLIEKNYPNSKLILSGERESLFRDIGLFYKCFKGKVKLSDYNLKNFSNKFIKLEDEIVFKSFSEDEQVSIKKINNKTKDSEIVGVTGSKINSVKNGYFLPLGDHVLTLVKDNLILDILERFGYGGDVIFQYTDEETNCKLSVKLVAYNWMHSASKTMSHATSDASKTTSNATSNVSNTASKVADTTASTATTTSDVITDTTEAAVETTGEIIVETTEEVVVITKKTFEEQYKKISPEIKNNVEKAYNKLVKDYKGIEGTIQKMAYDIAKALQKIECEACTSSVSVALSLTFEGIEEENEYLLYLIVQKLVVAAGTTIACDILVPYFQEFLHKYIKCDIVDECLANIICDIITSQGNLFKSEIFGYLAGVACWQAGACDKLPACLQKIN
ncbi:hypothetical protein CPAV1605_1427 [seawater metagenome]|uniref:Uncharacterized protein n=1 Tax=seawater metagenome TaxID=1561972 RepID=A0A5E8CMB6_9ZZZZ